MEKTTKYQYKTLILAIWLFWSTLLIGTALLGGGDLVSDPDDYMRMVEVHDLLDGQNWFDVSQHRINPPVGGGMHWSRWLDVPIAALYLIGSLFLSPDQANQFAFLATPALLFGALLIVIASVTEKLSNRTTALVAIFLIPTFPLLLRQFLPGRIDHHSWQILMAALALWGLLHKSEAKSGLIIGAALAFWMHVSIEGLPFAAAFGGLLAFLHFFPRYSSHGPQDSRLAWFAGALTGSSALFLLTARNSQALMNVYCDAVAWPLIAAMATSTIGILAATRLSERRMIGIIVVAATAAIGASVYIGASGGCALDPFGNLSPLVRSFWHETITEGLPINRQAPAIIAVLLFVPAVALMVLFLKWFQWDSAHRKHWGALAFLLGFAALMSFFVQRTASVTQLFALPFFGLLALMIVDGVKQIKLMPLRVLMTVLLLLCMMPMTAFFAGNLAFAAPTKKPIAIVDKALRPCSSTELQRLPTGYIFTTMAAGPDILFHTDHTVFVSGYHRNHVQMDRLITTMLGSPEQAEKQLRAAAVDYVVICPTHFETQSYLESGRDNFAAQLLSQAPPSWLRPVEGFEDSAMRVYRLAPPVPVSAATP